MKRKGFIKALGTLFAAPSLIENVGVEKEVQYVDGLRTYPLDYSEMQDEPPQWAKSFQFVKTESKFGMIYFDEFGTSSQVVEFMQQHPKNKNNP